MLPSLNSTNEKAVTKLCYDVKCKAIIYGEFSSTFLLFVAFHREEDASFTTTAEPGIPSCYVVYISANSESGDSGISQLKPPKGSAKVRS